MLRSSRVLALIRGVHTIVYVVMAASVFAIFYAGATGASGAWFWIPGQLVAIEVAVFVGNGMKCPMSAMAVRHGAIVGHDTFLPERLTRHTLQFFGPLIGVSIVLVLARWWFAASAVG
ncbi:MAG: hypothetical protein ABL871_17360 [Terricaulis sp.]